MAENGGSILELRQVSKCYAGEGQPVDVLRDVSFSVGGGEFVAITGPSGSGKSTLLHLMGALDTPTSGEVLINGEPLSALSSDDLADIRNRSIGFVFQLFNLVATLTIEENVMLPAVIARRQPAACRRVSAELLERVGLASKAQRFPSQLSGGEQQRVAIARALVMDAPALLADEPTGNLDTRTGAEIMAILTDLNAQGKTVVLVTHDPRLAAQTRRVVTIRDGEIVDDTPLSPARRDRHDIGQMVNLGDPNGDPLLA